MPAAFVAYDINGDVIQSPIEKKIGHYTYFSIQSQFPFRHLKELIMELRGLARY